MEVMTVLTKRLIAPAASYFEQWLQSVGEFPPRQKPGSVNVERVMEAVTTGQTGTQ